MKHIPSVVVLGALCVFGAPHTQAQHAASDHMILVPTDLKWAPSPALPAGAQIAVIQGPLSEAAPFIARVKFPANTKVPAHWHSAIEHVTVLSGCGGDYVCIADSSAPVTARTAETGTFAAQERCAEAPVDVTAASSDERRLACSAASTALQLLARCRISLRRPLQLQILNEVRHPFSGAIFGLFDTKQERVLVTQEANIPSLVKDTPYAKLPQRDFYRSLIVHEVVHGVMHQNLKRPATTHAAHEYPAYALQIESLPSSVRDTFLRNFDQLALNGQFLFNDTVLFFDPFFFAARAYKHFKASADGCAHLTALLQGDVAFIAPSAM